jgi:hypothetical protein
MLVGNQRIDIDMELFGGEVFIWRLFRAYKVDFPEMVCCETISTKPFGVEYQKRFLRNLRYGTFLLGMRVRFGSSTFISRNHERFLRCIEVKNLFRF